MDKTKLLDIIKAIASGNNEELLKVSFDSVSHTSIPAKFFSNDCLTTKLILGSNLYAMSERLKAKSSNKGTEAKSNADPARDKVIMKYLTSNPVTALLSKKSRASQQIEGLIKYLESDECKISTKTDLIDFLKNDAVKSTVVAGKMSILAPVYLHLIQTKLKATPSKVDDIVEAEKEYEGLIISLIDTKQSKLTMKSSDLRDEVRILAQAVDEANGTSEENRGKAVNEFLHDANAYSQMSLISNQAEHWHTGLNKDSAAPMRYVADNGESYRLFHTDPEKTQYLKDENSLINLAKNINESDKQYNSNLQTLMRKLQNKISGKDLNDDNVLDTRYAKPENLLQLYVETLLLATVVNECEISEQAVFSICDPLIEILKEGEIKNINDILEKAKADVKTICEEKGYTVDDSLAKAVLTPAAEKAKAKARTSAPSTATSAETSDETAGASADTISKPRKAPTPPPASHKASTAASEEERERVKQTQKLTIESIIGVIETRLGLKKPISDKKRKELKLDDSILPQIKDADLKGLKKIARSEKEKALIAQDIIDKLNLTPETFAPAKTTKSATSSEKKTSSKTKTSSKKSEKKESSHDIMVEAVKVELNQTNPRPNVTKMIEDEIAKRDLDLDALAKDTKSFTSTAKDIADQITKDLKNSEAKTAKAKPTKNTDDAKPVDLSKKDKKKGSAKDKDDGLELIPEDIVFDDSHALKNETPNDEGEGER